MMKRMLGIVALATLTAYAVAGCEDDSKGGGTSCAPNCSGLDASVGTSDASHDGDAGTTYGPIGFCNMQPNECLDYDYYDAPSAAKGCEVLHGTYSATGTCPHTDSPGGCKQTFANGMITTTWYYSPTTLDDVQATCQADGNAIFVAP